MRDLKDLNLGNRIAVTVVIVLVILFILATIGYFSGGWEEAEAQAVVECVDTKTRESIRQLAYDGIDEGFKDQIGHLFSIWLKDPHSQPTRAIVGTQNAISAYLRARKNADEWNPKLCG